MPTANIDGEGRAYDAEPLNPVGNLSEQDYARAASRGCAVGEVPPWVSQPAWDPYRGEL